MDLKRKIAKLEALLERAVQRYETSFGKSKNVILGNDYEHNRWSRIKLDEPTLVYQDKTGRTLLPTWDELTADIYSALRRTGTVLFEENQIAPTHRGNRKLLAPIVEGAEWEHIHDLTMGDDNMCVIAALRVQEGLIEEIKRQKDEANKRREEQKQRAEERRQQREEQKQEEAEDGDDGDSEDGEAGVHGDDNERGMGGGEEEEQDSESGEGAEGSVGQSGDSGDEGEEGEESSEGVGEEAGQGGSQGADGSTSAGAHGAAPEPNNAVESADAGAAAASAARNLVLSLQGARSLAESLLAEGDIEGAEEAVNAALEAAQDLTDASEDAEERLLAQQAYDDITGDQIGEALDKAITFAEADLKDQNEKLRAWGVGKGDLKELSPKEVIELVKGLRTNPDLKAIAELVGQQRRSRLHRKEKIRYDRGPTVRYGIETGRRVDHMLGSQKLLLKAAPDVFAHRLVNNQIQQYKTRIEEIQENGTGVIWIDDSGSMGCSGYPYTYRQVAKATAISLVEYFQEEGRDCVVGVFDHGVRDIIEVPKDISRGDLARVKLAIATRTYDGGTDFYAPLVTGFKIIEQREYLESADQVIITDGECWLTDGQVAEIKRLQDETKVNIITMVMPGGDADQLREFGPVDTVGTTAKDAVSLADKVVSTMDAGYE